MSLFEGVIVGTVKYVNDLDGQGRVFVEFPWMGGKQGYWASPATLMGGDGRGSWFMPEVDDEVLVAFDHGAVNHLYILGFLWNGKDKPPETDPNKRLFKSKKGHIILMDDRDGNEKIEITTGEGLKITMDTNASSIRLSGGGRTLELSNGLVQIS